MDKYITYVRLLILYCFSCFLCHEIIHMCMLSCSSRSAIVLFCRARSTVLSVPE